MRSWYVVYQEAGINYHRTGQRELRELLFLISFDRIADAHLHQYVPWRMLMARMCTSIGPFHFGGDGEVLVQLQIA